MNDDVLNDSLSDSDNDDGVEKDLDLKYYKSYMR